MGTWEAPAAPTRWIGPDGPSFVGRRREFRVLEDAWTAVCQGSRQVVFVGGEAGAGKSRLMQEAAMTLHGQGAAVLLGCCMAELSAPYEPFAEPLSVLRAAVLQGDLHVPAPLTDAEVVARLATVIGAEQPDPEARGRIVVYDAVVAAFMAAAEQRPVVLVLEDLHWSGASTLELLTYVSERARGARLLILASHRSTPPDRSEGVVDAIATMYRTEGVRRLDLGSLDVEEIAEYLVLETRATPATARRLATRLRDDTGGNAFYLRELVNDLKRDRGHLMSATAVLRMPEPVRDSFRRRLQQLGGQTLRLVQLAAVIGDSFGLPLLAAAEGSDAAEVMDAMEGVLQTGLVVAEEGPGGFRFVHALARAAVLDSVSAAGLARQHADVAVALDRDFPAAPNRLQRLAHHYAAAHVLGYAEQATVHLEAAGEDARARMAHIEAAEMLQRGASLAHDAWRRDDLLLRAAEAFRDGGNFASAYRLARQVADQGSPADRLRAGVVFEGAAWRVGQSGEEAVAMLSRALNEVDADVTDSLRVTARASLARALEFSGSPARAEELVVEAIAEARRLGDSATLAHALEAALMVLPRPDVAGQQWARACELSELAEASGDTEHAVQAASIRTMVAYLLGRTQEMEDARAALARATRLTGTAFHRMELYCGEFSRWYAAGDLQEASRYSEKLAEISDQLVAADTTGAVALQGFLLRREALRLDEVRPYLRGDESLDDRWAPGLLALYLELGMREPARRVLAWLIEHLAVFTGSSTWPATLAFLSEAVVGLRDHEAASVVLRELRLFSGANLAVGPLCVVFGSADRHIGTVLSMLGEAEADVVLAAAVEQERAMGATLFLGYALAARAAHQGTRPGEVAAWRAEATALARTSSLPRLRKILGDADGHAPDGLTAREVEVLRLLGEGLSNRDLANRLFISENTATNHVRSIFMKTGSENRTQAARYAANHGLLE